MSNNFKNTKELKQTTKDKKVQFFLTILKKLPKSLFVSLGVFLALGMFIFSGDETLAKELGFLEILQVFKQESVKQSNLETSKVYRVVDGDTLILENGKTVRLLNVDTPETVKPNSPVMCYGPEASEFSKKLLTGKQVWLKTDKEATDRYGRDLRFVFLSEQETDDINNSVNAMLVKAGFAREKTYKPNNTYQKVFQKLQFEAEQKKVGAWKDCPKPFEE